MTPAAGTPLPDAVAEELAGRVRGPLLLPGDEAYEDARSVWNARVDRHPACVVRCTGAADVLAGVDVARDHDVALSVLGNGHHVTGAAVRDGALLLDLSEMDGVRVDPAAQSARVGPGATVADLDHEAQAFGLATTGAPISTVGIAGFTLGGGLGWTMRAHGLACDNLLSADVVTAGGVRVEASEDENSDLFWALRGGGGDFGVVTSFEFHLHPVGPEVLSGRIVHGMDDALKGLRAWRDLMAGAPDSFTCMPVVAKLPPDPGIPESVQGESALIQVPFWDGDPAEGRRLLRPLLEAGDPVAAEFGLVPYADLLSDMEETFRAGHRNYYRSAYFDELPDAALETLLDRADPAPTPWSSLFLEPLGGAVARRDPDATAYPHRGRSFCVTAVPKWEDTGRDDRMEAWADGVFEALEPWSAPGVYVNYLDRDVGQGARAAYGDNLDRLVEVKDRWDPDGLFRGPHPVEPAG